MPYNSDSAVLFGKVKSFLRKSGYAISESNCGEEKQASIAVVLNSGGHFSEQRYTIRVCADLIIFEVKVPIRCGDGKAMCRVVNEMNLVEFNGCVHLDTDNDEIRWAGFLPASDSEWPGDDAVVRILKTGGCVVDRIVHRLQVLVQNSGTEED